MLAFKKCCVTIFVSFIIEIGGNDACKSFSQCACYRNYWRYYIRRIFLHKWEWQYTETTFLFTVCRELDKGDLKTLEIQPEQNVYLVSGKTKMMKITLQRFYTITKKTYKNYK